MSKTIFIFSGSTGSIAQSMPKRDNIIPVFFRLEETQKQIYNKIKLFKADVFIHFAGITDIQKCNNKKKNCNYININGAKKVFIACQKAKIKKFIFISSSHVYGISLKLDFFSTKRKLNPQSNYAESKVEAEKQLLKIEKKGNTKLCSARIFSVLANNYRKNSLQYKVHNLAKKNKMKFIEGLNNYRDFLSSSQICKNLLLLGESKTFPKKVNICSGKPKKIFDVVSNIYSEYNINFKKNYNFQKNEIPSFLVGIPSKF